MYRDDQVLWKVIDFPGVAKGAYKVSENGMFKNVVSDSDIETYHSPNGYDFVMLVVDNELREKDCRYYRSPRMYFRVDILVATAFVKCDEQLYGKSVDVCHKNSDTHDNCSDNLEWCEFVEEWRPITYGDIVRDKYEISSTGNIRSLDDTRLAEPRYDKYEYLMITLKLNHRTEGGYDSKPFKIHRLVAHEWFGESTNDVNHINGLPFDNNWKNLEYATRSDNIKHAVKTGLQDSIPVKDIEMVYDMLYKNGGRPKAVYNTLDHEKYPRLTHSLVKAVKRGFYDHKIDMTNRKPLPKLFVQTIHRQPLTVDEMDELRDLIIANKYSCKVAFDNIDHEKFPTVTYTCMKDLKFGRAPYDKSNKFSEDEISAIRHTSPDVSFIPHNSKINAAMADEIRTLLNEYDGKVSVVYKVLDNPNVNKYNISDVRNGKNKRPSEIYDLSQNAGKYPFIKK